MPELHDWYNCCGARIMYSVAQNKPSEKMFQYLYGRRGTSGIIAFIDNDQKIQQAQVIEGKYVQDTEPSNGGDEWAKFIRAKGYRVDQIFLGQNPNHPGQAGHKLTMYIWYVNEEKDKESVIVGVQPKKPILPKVETMVNASLGAIFGGSRAR